MARRRSPRVHILLPGEREHSRRSFLVKGVVGSLLLALGAGLWFARRKTRVTEGAVGPLAVFTPDEAAVLLAIADRLVPEHPAFPRPGGLSLARRMDGVAAMADPATRQQLRRLLRLFESAVAGFFLDAQVEVFTASSPAAQDRRLRSWAESRIAIRRTGYRALKRLVYASYYGAPESWTALGYPGPPIRPPVRPPQPPATPASTAASRPGAAPPLPRRRRPPPPLTPFSEQPLDPEPTLIVPRVNDG